MEQQDRPIQRILKNENKALLEKLVNALKGEHVFASSFVDELESLILLL